MSTKLVSLMAHLDKQRTALKAAESSSPPKTHVTNGTLPAYRKYLEKEIERTEKKIEVVRAIVPKIGKGA
jgi:hypothetical protein